MLRRRRRRKEVPAYNIAAINTSALMRSVYNNNNYYSTLQYSTVLILLLLLFKWGWRRSGSEIRETEGRNTLITNCCSVVLLYIFTINMYEKTYTLYTARHQTEEAGEWNRKGLWMERRN